MQLQQTELLPGTPSYKHVRTQNREELLDAAPRGRLLRYDVKSKTMTVLLCGLHFANGVQVTHIRIESQHLQSYIKYQSRL